MKTEQEQIEEMAQDMYCAEDSDIYICLNGCSKACGVWKYEKRPTIPTGYRKASDVIDEFVERVKERALQSCHKIINCYEVTRIETVIDEIADEMRQEVEK